MDRGALAGAASAAVPVTATAILSRAEGVGGARPCLWDASGRSPAAVVLGMLKERTSWDERGSQTGARWRGRGAGERGSPLQGWPSDPRHVLVDGRESEGLRSRGGAGDRRHRASGDPCIQTGSRGLEDAPRKGRGSRLQGAAGQCRQCVGRPGQTPPETRHPRAGAPSAPGNGRGGASGGACGPASPGQYPPTLTQGAFRSGSCSKCFSGFLL